MLPRLQDVVGLHQPLVVLAHVAQLGGVALAHVAGVAHVALVLARPLEHLGKLALGLGRRARGLGSMTGEVNLT